MNTTYFINLKNLFLKSAKTFFTSNKLTIKTAITGLLIIAFASILFVGCGDNDEGAKKTDNATQLNEQRSEVKSEGQTSCCETGKKMLGKEWSDHDPVNCCKNGKMMTAKSEEMTDADKVQCCKNAMMEHKK